MFPTYTRTAYTHIHRHTFLPVNNFKTPNHSLVQRITSVVKWEILITHEDHKGKCWNKSIPQALWKPCSLYVFWAHAFYITINAYIGSKVSFSINKTVEYNHGPSFKNTCWKKTLHFIGNAKRKCICFRNKGTVKQSSLASDFQNTCVMVSIQSRSLVLSIIWITKHRFMYVTEKV